MKCKETSANSKKRTRARHWPHQQRDETTETTCWSRITVRRTEMHSPQIITIPADNARPEVGIHARTDSPIIGLKKFNNWVKSVLIQKMAVPPLQISPSKRATTSRGKPSAPLSGRVLDIGCGKGGDLRKWQKARIMDYLALDIATVSVNQARDRWVKMRGGERFDAFFAQGDCYSVGGILFLRHQFLLTLPCRTQSHIMYRNNNLLPHLTW